jgi:NHLM bacteriocin system ABC transporter ATP-binding protein
MPLPTAAGRSLELEAGQIFYPAHEEGFVLVTAGSVEIYVNTPARRVFLSEVKAGGVLMGPLERPGEMAALASEDAKVLLVGREDWARLLTIPEKAANFAVAVDRWFAGLAEGVARLALRRPSAETLVHGQVAAVEKTTSLTSAYGMFWVECPDGGWFMDVVAVSPGSLEYLTPKTWITVDSGEIRAVKETSEILAEPGWEERFTRVTATLTDAARTIADADREEEIERAVRLDEKTTQDLDSSREKFQGILATTRVQQKLDTDLAFVYERVTRSRPSPDSLKDEAATLESFAAANGCRLRGVPLQGPWWTMDRGPLVAFKKDGGQPVALIPDWLGRYRLHERGMGSRRVGPALAATLAPQAAILSLPLPNKPLRVRDITLIGLILCSMDLGTLALATLASSLLGLVAPLTTGALVDMFIPGAMRHQTLLLGLALVVVQGCMALMKLAGGFCRQRMDGRIAERVHGGVMDRLMRLPTALTRSMGAVDLAMRVSSVDSVRRTVMNMVLNALMSGITGLTGIFVLLYYSPLSGAMAAGLVAIMIGAAVLAGMLQLKAFTEGEAMSASVYTLTQQIIENITVLRAFGAERRAFALWARNSAEMRRRGLRARAVASTFEAFIAAYQTLSVAAIFAILAFTMGGNAKVSTGGYMVFVSTFQGFLAAGLTLARGCNQLCTMQTSVKRGEPLLKNAPETPPAAKTPGDLSGAIEVSNITFEHQPGVPVLAQVSFRVSPGAFVGLAGPSGSGKSTLLALLVGFEKPRAGAILYDGRDIAGLDLAGLRSQIGLVRQGGRLFPGSLLENILGAKKGDVNDAWKAAELSGIAEDIRAMPMGMHTVVTEGAAAFSGGQVQRILLARALVGGPKILMLDEATSALDNVSQAAIAANVEKIGATRIVVAHRLSAIRNADLILFLDQGRVVESGTYKELTARDGPFARFAARQEIGHGPAGAPA